MTKKKKVIIISSAIAAAIAAAALILYFTVFRQSGADKSKGTVYVEFVAALLIRRKHLKSKKAVIKQSKRFLSKKARKLKQEHHSLHMILVKFR